MRLDPDRLALLRQCMILDSAPERAYDDMVRLLADGLNVSTAMVNLLDSGRDWFKAAVGTPLRESPAATSFCNIFFHTNLDLLVVEDTTLDPRFADHPLVLGTPRIRFYAAARLRVHGQTLGTLCAYDDQPRHISVEQVQQLQTLAAAVAARLALRLKAA